MKFKNDLQRKAYENAFERAQGALGQEFMHNLAGGWRVGLTVNF